MTELGAGAGSGYPAAIDTKQTFLNTGSPLSDGPTRMDAEVLNDALGALVAIEAELGVAPSGVWATVVARLDAFLVGSVAVPQLIVAGAGPHAIGTSISTNFQVNCGGAFTGDASGTRGWQVAPTLTGVVNGDIYGIVYNPTLVESGSGTHNLFAGVYMALAVSGGAAALTNAAVLYIPEGPSGATNNYSLWVDAGLVRLDTSTGAGVGVGTITNVPNAGGGNPAVYFLINLNGTSYAVPGWAL